MEINLGYLKGMQPDLSPTNRDNESYQSAINIDITGHETYGSIVNSDGNKLLFELPTIGKAWNVTLPAEASVPKLNFIVDGKLKATIWGGSLSTMYNNIINNPSLNSFITEGNMAVYYNNREIKIISLNNSTINLSGAGGTEITIINPGGIPVILGYKQVRDYIFLLTTITGTVDYGQIWKIKYDYNNKSFFDLNGTLLVPSKHLIYVERLKFDWNIPIIEIVAKYNNESLCKLYIADGRNELRHFNVLDSELLGTSLSLTGLVPDIVLSTPKIIETRVGGSYKSGTVKYAYQLYNLSGAETVMSPASGSIHLADALDYSPNTSTYKGTAPDTDTKKSVVVNIPIIDPTYDMIKVWAIHSTSTLNPTISLVYENKISTNSVTFTDTGNITLDTLTTEEFNMFTGRTFIPKTITSKDNYLIAGNIQEQLFDIDEVLGYHWDARAYRTALFNTRIFKINGEPIQLSLADTVEESNNCIFHQEDDYNEGYKYNRYGVLGGSGVNIDYEFTITKMYIDTIAGNIGGHQVGAGNDNWPSILGTPYYPVNNSYCNYSSPINDAYLKGYRRGEVYRFGIEFIDNRGRRSFVKWIGDIKFPEVQEEDTKVLYNANGTDVKDYRITQKIDQYNSIQANILGIKFKVNNLPSGYSYRIVRAKREDSDKRIVTTGILKPIIQRLDYNDDNHNVCSDFTSRFDDQKDILNMYRLISPEQAFGLLQKDIKGMNMQVVSKLAYIGQFFPQQIGHHGLNVEGVYRYKLSSEQMLTNNTNVEITDSIQTYPSYSSQYLFNNVNNTTYTYIPYYNVDLYGKGYTGRSFVMATKYQINTALTGNYYVKATIKNLNNHDYRYGGLDYASRQRTTYYPCSGLINTTNCIIYGGDTTINMFDYLDCAVDPEQIVNNPNKSAIGQIIFPTESDINIDLRNDTPRSRNTLGATEQWKLVEKVADGKNLYNDKTYDGNDFGDYPSSFTDLYLYNQAYSDIGVSEICSTKPINYIGINTVDYRIISSENSIPGEYVDGWTKFLYNSYIDLTSEYGSVNKILVNNGKLYSWQDRAFAMIAFKDRELISTDNGTSLTLGVGGILSYSQYISIISGCMHPSSVMSLDTSVIWFDALNKKVYMLSDRLEPLSDVKMCSSVFNLRTNYRKYLTFDNMFLLGVDKDTSRVYFTLADSELDIAYTVAYNGMLSFFESYYNFIPKMYIPSYYGMVTIPSSRNSLWLHSEDASKTTYYGIPYEWGITTLFGNNQKFLSTNLEFNYESPIKYSPDVDSNFTIKYKNSYSYGESTKGSAKKRFRTYRVAIPRSNRGERFLDYWIQIKFIFDNSNDISRLDNIKLKGLIPLI